MVDEEGRGARLKYFPLLIDRWVAGTRHLGDTPQERYLLKGAYLELLIYLYEGGAPIKGEKYVGSLLGLHPRVAAKVWGKLRQKFTRNQHGYTHRLVTELLRNGGRIKGLGMGAEEGVGAGAEGGGFPATRARTIQDPIYTPYPTAGAVGNFAEQEGEDWASPGSPESPRPRGANPRRRGANPRALGESPRQTGENPRNLEHWDAHARRLGIVRLDGEPAKAYIARVQAEIALRNDIRARDALVESERRRQVLVAQAATGKRASEAPPNGEEPKADE